MKNNFIKLIKKTILTLGALVCLANLSYGQVPSFYNYNAGLSTNSFPLSTTSSNKVQWIYEPLVFNSMGSIGGTAAYLGLIDKVYFRSGSSSAPNFTDFTIQLAQNVGTQPAWPNATYNTGMTQVFNLPSHAITALAGNWFSVTLQTPFLYDPNLSLVVEMKQNGYTGSGLTVRQNGTTAQRIWGPYANSIGSGFGSGLADFGFDLLPPTPCDSIVMNVGQLAPHNPTICAGQSLNMSAPSAVLGSSLIYQWQSSPNGTAWTNIGGATNLNYQTPTLASTIHYRLIMTCTINNLKDTSLASKVTVSVPTYAPLPYAQSFENWASYCNNKDVPDDYHWKNSILTGNESWRREDEGATAGWNSPNAGLYFPVASHGNHSARFHSYFTTGVGNLDLYVNCTGAGIKTLSFDYINDNTASGTDNLKIEYSTNGGSFFLPVAQYSGSVTWQSIFVNIPSTTATTIIRFSATGGTNLIPASDIGVDNIKVLSPCTGTPVAGVIDSVTACPNRPLVLNIIGGTLQGGVNYRWEKSTTGSAPWTFVGNSAGPTFVTSLGTPTYWRCIMTCQSTGLSDTTLVRYVDVLPFYICYCENQANTVFYENIGNVKIRDKHGSPAILNNGNPLPSLSNPTSVNPYSLFFPSVTPVILYTDSSYYIDVSGITFINNFGNSYAKVYIDYNRDGVYNVTNEQAFKGAITSAGGFVGLDSFKVPTITNFGLTGMRVILQQGGNQNTVTPCGSFGQGEVEDYVVNLQRLPCNSPPSGGISYIDDSTTCPNNRIRIVNNTHDRFFANLNFSWQESIDGTTFNDIPGGTVDTMFRTVNQNMWYRYRVTCKGTSTAYSNIVRVRILPPLQCLGVSKGTGPNDISDIGAMVISEPPPTNTNLYTFSTGGPHLNNPASYKYYTNYTAAGPLDLRVDTNYKISIYQILKTAVHTDAQVTVFIDFNNNLVFDLPQEKVFSGFTTPANFFLVGNINIPANAVQGTPVLMRVVMNDDLGANPASNTGMGTYISGETEDYYLRFGPKKTPIGVESISNIESVGIYPNPTPGIVNVDFNAKQPTGVKIEVVNLTGAVLHTTDMGNVSGKQHITLDLNGVASGVYLMRFTTDNSKFVRKITVN